MAWAYDGRYGKAGDKLMGSTSRDEILRQNSIMQAIQQGAPYVRFMQTAILNDYPSEAQKFFRSGGRILTEAVYSKGVKVNSLQYHWDGSSWFVPIPSGDPNAYSRTSKVLHLSIEPTTMRYVESATVTTTVGKGETAATGTEQYGPLAGICKAIPDPN
jgi:hypothetical protein